MDLKTYYQTISAMGKLAMAKKKAEGQTMHLAPLGYRNVRRDGRSVTEPDPKAWVLVEEATALRRQGHSIREICRLMAEKGLNSKRGKAIGPSSMFKLLRRR